MAHGLAGCAAIQRDLNRLEKRASGNRKRFSKGKCKVLLLGRNSSRHQYVLGTSRLKNSLAGEDLGVLVG